MTGREEQETKIEKKIEKIINGNEILDGYNDYYKYQKRRSAYSRRTNLYTISRLINHIEAKGEIINWNSLCKKKYIWEFMERNKKRHFNTQKGYLFALKQFYRYAKAEGYITENPVEDFEIESGEDDINKPRLTENDFREILENIENGVGSSVAKSRQKSAKSRDRFMILLLMNCGMRESALCAINVDDIKENENGKLVLTIRDKGNRVHLFDISHLKNDYESWMFDRKYSFDIGKYDSDALFVSSRRQRISQQALISLVRKYTNGKLSPHDLRRGLITIMLENGIPIETVCKFVGHKNIQTTMRYDRRDFEIKEAGAEFMAGITGLTQRKRYEESISKHTTVVEESEPIVLDEEEIDKLISKFDELASEYGYSYDDEIELEDLDDEDFDECFDDLLDEEYTEDEKIDEVNANDQFDEYFGDEFIDEEFSNDKNLKNLEDLSEDDFDGFTQLTFSF